MGKIYTMTCFRAFTVACLILLYTTVVYAIEDAPEIHFVVQSFQVKGDNPLTLKETNLILNRFKGEHYGLEGLVEAGSALQDAMQKAGFAFHRASLPPQTLKDGIILLQVNEFSISDVIIEGNKHFDNENIRLALPTLEPGKTPNTRVLSRAIALSNSNPTRQMRLQFTENPEGAGIDAKIKVNDDKPGFFYSSLNNTGTDDTGDLRLSLGYQYTNLFNKDHSLSLSYTTSPEQISDVTQFGLSYRVPFYEQGASFSVLLSASDVDSGLVADLFEVSGAGQVVALRYNQRFLQQGAYKQELIVGLDHKLFENNVSIAGAPLTGTGDVVSQPVSLNYIGSWQSTSAICNFNVGVSTNISGGSDNSDVEYDNARSGAKANWLSYKISAGVNYNITPTWLLKFNLDSQFSDDTLIPGEQYGLGGMNTIRGYPERTVLGDTGYRGGLELWTPTVSSYNLRPVIFLEAGHTENNVEQPNVASSRPQDPASAGFGVRFNWRKYLSARIDAAYVLETIGTTEDGDTKIHFDLFVRY